VRASRGGKRAEDAGLQGGPIVLDREQIAASLLHDLFADLPLGQEGIRRHHPSRERQPGQHLLGRGDLLPFALGAQLGDDHLGLMGVGRHQMHARHRRPSTPRNVFPSTASGSSGAAPVRASQPPTASSKASAPSALETRCHVAAHGRRPAGKPSSRNSAGSSSCRPSTHWAIAFRPRAPPRIAATQHCNSTTRGTGGYSRRQP
jgi:hypothetical protein